MKVIVVAAVLCAMLPQVFGYCCGGDGSGICGDKTKQGAGCCGHGPCNVFCCNCDPHGGSKLLSEIPIAITLPLPRPKFTNLFSVKNAEVAVLIRNGATFLRSLSVLTLELRRHSMRLISLAPGPSLCPTTSNI